MAEQTKRRERAWSLQSTLHRDVVSLLREHGLRYKFHMVDDEESAVDVHDSHVMGTFDCRNRQCRSGGWSSRKIPVSIRHYEGGRYNARVYHQRCKKCGEIGSPSLDESYAHRVAFRIKKWNGVQVEAPVYSHVSRRPHDSRLCLGCAVNRCRESAVVGSVAAGSVSNVRERV